MSVEVRLFGILRQIAGQNSIEIIPLQADKTSWSVGDVLKELTKQYPKLEKEIFSSNSKSINPIYRLLLNSKEITFKSPLTQPVQPGDVLQFFPPVSGGHTSISQVVR